MNSELKKIIISPPFGTYLHLNDATSVKGSFTLTRRPGKWKEIFKTVRLTPEGWVNKVGLRAGSIQDLDKLYSYNLYSLAAITKVDWDIIHAYFVRQNIRDIMVELNVSCPNVEKEGPPSKKTLENFAKFFNFVGLKLPSHYINWSLINDAIDAGITTFHCGNTFPTERGGISGKTVKEFSIPQIEQIKNFHSNVTIIGGGGIYTPQDVVDYHNAGADYFSLATIWFTPWLVPPVLKKIREIM